MKKTLVGFSCILIIVLLLIFSRNSTNDDVFSKFQKKINNFENYKCIEEITIRDEEGKSFYKIEKLFVKPNEVKMKIIEPEKSKGCIIIYDDDRIFLEHPYIGRSISMKNIKSINKEIFIEYFFKQLSSSENPKIEEEKIDKNEYMIFTIDVPNKNRYRQNQKLWINKKNFIPYKLNILDENGEISVEIKYSNFYYNIELKDKI